MGRGTGGKEEMKTAPETEQPPQTLIRQPNCWSATGNLETELEMVGSSEGVTTDGGERTPPPETLQCATRCLIIPDLADKLARGVYMEGRVCGTAEDEMTKIIKKKKNLETENKSV